MAHNDSSNTTPLVSDLLLDINELVNMVSNCGPPLPEFSEVDLLNGTMNKLDTMEDFDPIANYHLPFRKDPLLTQQLLYDEIRHLRLWYSKLERCVDNLN